MSSWIRRICELVVVCLLAAGFGFTVRASEWISTEAARRWNARTIRLSLSDSLLRSTASIKSGSDVQGAIQAAMATWSQAAPLKFELAESTLESVSDHRSGGDGTSLITIAATSENLTLFPKQEKSPPAYTRLFFDRQGRIIEADIVLNPFLQYSTDGTPGTYDLQSVIAHELGHSIGLGHSPVRASTMFERISPNREDLEGFGPRTLSESDVSFARSLYGPGVNDGDCCASVFGMLSGKTDQTGVVWAEEAATGRLIAAEHVTPGQYALGGLKPGSFRILAQGSSGSAVRIGEQDLLLPTRMKNVGLGSQINADLAFVGLNGELSSMPLTLSRGRSYQLFLGGKGLDPKTVSFGFTSRSIAIIDGTVFPVAYANGVSAAALTISIAADTPEGDYSIFVETPTGARRYLIGGISITS